jgi:aldehyde dehydrogenase (NAD+)
MPRPDIEAEPRQLIDGRLVLASSGATFPNIDPATEEPVGTTADGTLADADAAIAAARQAFDETGWSTDHALRRHCLLQLRDAVEEMKEEFRKIDTAETGRPFARTAGSIDRNIPTIGQFAELATNYGYEQSLADFPIPGTGLLRREAAGVVSAIYTWNCGFYLNVMKTVCAMAAGNTVVARPAPETPWQTTLFGRLIAERTDTPPGVVNVIVSQDPRVAALLTTDDRIDQVSFTGSTTVGRQIMAQAAPTVKRLSLELGGKSAAILLDDADFASAIPQATLMIWMNAGQTCAALTRLLIPRSRYEEGVELAAATLAGIRPGDPWDPECGIGPLISAAHRDRVLGYIQKATDDCRLVLGGGPPDGHERGYFVEPTVFADVPPDHVIAREEIFGPVLAIIPYEGDDDAVRVANDSIYGLAGAVFTGDQERGLQIARRIRSGQVAVNGVFSGGPFGGYKQSGVGREVGVWGFEDYLQTKAIGVS